MCDIDEFVPNLNNKVRMVSTIAEIIQKLLIIQKENGDVNLNELKSQISSKYELKSSSQLVDIISVVSDDTKNLLYLKLNTEPVQTTSGVVIVAVMCELYCCFHINICVYYPGHPDSDCKYSIQLYTDYEPTSMTAIQAHENAYYVETHQRVEEWKQLGPNVDKVEFIVMGGTFMSLCEENHDAFIRNLHKTLSGQTNCYVQEAMKFSKRSNAKYIGITIETQQDNYLNGHLTDMLNYGCTQLEIEFQFIFENLKQETNKGHTEALCKIFNLAKDCGFNVILHMILGLPNIDLERDLQKLKEFFENPDFRVDCLKIDPTLVMEGTSLYEVFKGRYCSYSSSELVDSIANILSVIPPWIHVFGVQKDISMPSMTSGIEHGNLLELALVQMKDLNLQCRDIQTREVRIQEIPNKFCPHEIELIRRDYVANNGWETFLSYEDPEQDILIGFLRLRKCTDSFRPELKGRVSIIRELHLYGSVVPVHPKNLTKFQYQEFGMLLMEEAERIALKEHKSTKIVFLSGVGISNNHSKRGYDVDGPYMSKLLKYES